jgi:hypothetical protein
MEEMALSSIRSYIIEYDPHFRSDLILTQFSVSSKARTYSELLGLWTLSIVQNSKHNVSETGCFRPLVRDDDIYSVGSLRKS